MGSSRVVVFAAVIGIGASVAYSCSSKAAIEYKQYFIKGEELYATHCSNCHQANGKGLGRLYPPLDQSDYVDQHFEEVLCLMKYGEDSVRVNGVLFTQPMKGISTLTDIEIAELATYIYNSWGRRQGKVSTQQVTEALKTCEP